jgi:hypothetical protein
MDAAKSTPRLERRADARAATVRFLVGGPSDITGRIIAVDGDRTAAG